jgi:hypothetical protein
VIWLYHFPWGDVTAERRILAVAIKSQLFRESI